LTLTEPHVRPHRLPPARAFTMPATAAGSSVDIIQGGGVLLGWALEETTGAATARVVVGDGNVAGVPAQIIAPVRLAANESNREYPPGGIVFRRSVTLQVTAGSVAGAVWLILCTPVELDALTRLYDY
jgi:hypothetical protein